MGHRHDITRSGDTTISSKVAHRDAEHLTILCEYVCITRESAFLKIKIKTHILPHER